MIPVALQPEPTNFDCNVRQPGIDWLIAQGLNPVDRQVSASKLKNYWTNCRCDLWHAYSGICAYSAIYVGCGDPKDRDFAFTIDHFIPKSKAAAMTAYEWCNYRPSTRAMNEKKRDLTCILDPFTIRQDTFFLTLTSGIIRPNDTPEFKSCFEVAQKTIDMLKLNNGKFKNMRAKHYNRYVNQEVDLNYLHDHSPFVCYEICRQGLV